MKKIVASLIAALIAAGVSVAQTVTLQVSPTKLLATGTLLDGPAAQTFYIGSYSTNAYTSEYTVAVSRGTNWMSVDVASGSTTGEWDAVTLTYDTAGLAAGIYEGEVAVVKTNALGGVQTKTIAVTLRIEDEGKRPFVVGPYTLMDPNGFIPRERLVNGTWQIDTNDNTVATEYTPRERGDLLAGFENGTGTVWISKGTTTNDWQQLFKP